MFIKLFIAVSFFRLLIPQFSKSLRCFICTICNIFFMFFRFFSFNKFIIPLYLYIFM
nr:MAG TPA: hypothetical protein [Caudoviricetes sp.]